ncbi:ribosome biogenesis protein NOP53 [Alosa sapidissima]|uniref:ribosome biogenesis protein NOP53 n=1 Tax=Alosa sapidissima TaxID=34773 RepID=UPI001C094D99|nr:ribosome biogenesis protein NOP53 [Alosa sapidissima]
MLRKTNMAAARKHKRVAASQPGFLSLKSSTDISELNIGRKKRVNKNKKKNWNKFSDIQDVEEFLDDVRLQERATGGLIADKSDDSLFFLDIGESKKKESLPTGGEEEDKKKRKNKRPLKVDLILQANSHIPAPKDILAHQQPNAKKLRRKQEQAEQLAAKGVVPRRERLLELRRAAFAAGTPVREKTVPNNNPERAYYDLWGDQPAETADGFYLEQTKKKPVKRPEKLNERPSELPAIEVIAPGGSYNPDFFSHQELLREAHEVEVKKLKAEERLERQLAVNRQELATEETTFKEQIQGLLDEEEQDEGVADEMAGDEEDTGMVSSSQQEKKTERQRKKEKADKLKEQQRRTEREVTSKRQQLFQLRSIQLELKKREQRTRLRQSRRKALQLAQKTQPRRLGRLKFQNPDLDVQLSDELAGSLRRLKPEGSVLKDRFKSFQKRNMIEPRERAKFKRKYKLKYVEKRAFKAIT